MKTYCFIFLFFIGVKTIAQQTIVLTDTTSLISIGNRIDLFEDPKGKLLLSQILSPQYQSQFKKSEQKVPNYGTKQTSVWSRIRIKNTSGKSWMLNVDFPYLHNVMFFQPSGNGYTKEETGRSFSFNKRTIKNRTFIFPLKLKTGEEKEFYLRVENHICIFPVYIGDMTAISEKQYPEDLFYGAFYGVSFIIAFYALALFVAAREKYYLFFFLQVIFFALYLMIYYGDASRWFPGIALALTDYGTVIISTGIIFVYLFFDAVLKTKRRVPLASYTFLGSAALIAFSVLLYLAGYRAGAVIINMLVSFSAFFTALALCFYLKKEKIIRLIFIGFCIGFVGIVFWILMQKNSIPYSRFTNHLFMIQSMWWMIIFSVALELNINNYIKEKYQAQKELLLNLAEKEKLILHQNEMLEQKVEERTKELKETQSQLIQREKMASLVELTAGVAHEIQNPLNFVNNFSEVSTDLLNEMKEEFTKDNVQGAIMIAESVKENLGKILYHGKRADAIVKGMLQHSRVSLGKKELTDINALTHEYFRLSYHGMQAKDKSFNATLKTDFDESVGKINVVPQDFGRLLLNLFNNAFYAVSEKEKQKLNGYKPTVIVSTSKNNDKVEIQVKDNGNGIPQTIIDKIFQPFFTTKPTGQGTGLGLSLSYDIIKAHGGEIKVETKEGQGAEFLIQLPI
jgi:signal transduction histidine kinase